MTDDDQRPSFADVFGDKQTAGSGAGTKPLDPSALAGISGAGPVGTVRVPAAGPRFDGDTSELPAEACWALQELVAMPHLRQESRKLWAAMLAHETVLRSRLSELGLLLEVDEDRGFAFTRQAADPSPHSRVLLRARPLSLAASTLALWLYNQYLLAPGDPVVEEQDMIDHLLGYKPSADTDEARFTDVARAAIRTVKDAHLIEPIPGTSRYLVYAVITSILSAERVSALTARYQDLAAGTAPPAAPPGGAEDRDDSDDEEDTGNA